MRTLVAAMIICTSLLVASPVGAEVRPDGPTGGDFISGGVFDQAGYLAALVAFQTAPDVAKGSTIELVVHQCKAGDLAEAVLLGWPETLVGATVPASGVVTLALTIPLNVEPGFNRIRVSCTEGTQVAGRSALIAMAAATPYLVKDIVINIVAPGTPTAISSLDVYMVAAPAPPTARGSGLPRTGSEARGLIGAGLALLLVGAALAMGVRERLREGAAL